LDRETLYELRPAEFERLCVEILKTLGFESVQLVGGPAEGVDVIAQKEGRPVAVGVKHARRLSPANLRDIVLRLQANAYEAKELLVITSAAVTNGDIASASIPDLSSKGVSVRIFGRDNLLKILAKHANVEQAIVPPARNRSRRQQYALWLGVISGLASILASLSMSFFFDRQTQAPLNQRIETVERAIGSLKNLEQDLTDIKNDMVDTERSVKAMKDEYAKAKELEKLTEAQFDAVKAALRNRSWQQTVLNYVLGFVLGIASSLTASVIYSRWKQRRALAQ